MRPGVGDVADEAQAGCGLVHGRHRRAVLAEHSEVADHRLEPAPVARAAITASGSIRVPSARCTPPSSSDSTARHDLDPAVPDRVDHLVVHDRGRDSEALQPAHDALLGLGEPELREVADLLAANDAHQVVPPRRGQLDDQPPQEGTQRLAQHDVRRRADGEPHAGGAALGEVVGDLHPGRAGADHEHVVAAELFRVPVLRGVDQPASERVAAGPSRDPEGVLVARRDDHVAGRFSPVEVWSSQPPPSGSRRSTRVRKRISSSLSRA